MTAEDRFYKQLEEISSSIMRALEALEKELTEYIGSTDKRLQTLEEKVQKMESFIEITSRGVTSKIDDLNSKPYSPAPSIQKLPEQSTLIQPIESEPQERTPMSAFQGKNISSPITKVDPPTPLNTYSLVKEESNLVIPPLNPEQPSPIPKPPVYTPALEKEDDEDIITLPERKEPLQKRSEGALAIELEEKKKKEQDKDKEELLSALKMIDEL